MSVNITLLLLAVALLWFPRQWLRLGAVLLRRRSRRSSPQAPTVVEPWNAREPGDPRVFLGTEIRKLRNFIDLFRAMLGAVCIVGGLRIESALLLSDGAPGSQVKALIAVKGLILLVGLLVQTIRYERSRLTFYPPIFYLAGLSVPLCEPAAAGFAFVAVWALNPAFGSAQAFLTVYAALMVAFGQYFAGLGDKTAIFAGLLCFLPVLLSLLANRPLIIMARKAQHHRTGEASS
jgi:hypothetical protein